MAEVFKKIGGKKVTKIVALHVDVQNELQRRAVQLAAPAAAQLAKHRYSGAAEIEIDRGRVDRYVVLVDKAAVPIEYGGKGGRGGVAPLRTAMRMASGGV